MGDTCAVLGRAAFDVHKLWLPSPLERVAWRVARERREAPAGAGAGQPAKVVALWTSGVIALTSNELRGGGDSGSQLDVTS
jgi:hypothetical protein